MKSTGFICRVRSLFLVLSLIVFCVGVYAQGNTGKKSDDESLFQKDQLKPRPSGYLEGGTSTYGVEEQQAIKDDSPLLELKMLRKKFFREQKSKEGLDEENRMLKRRISDLESIMQRKDSEIDELKRKVINADFRYVALEQQLTKFQIAILRKKMIRESQYPPFYEVKKNDSLWKIAGLKNIYDNNYKWIELYHANKDKVADPDYLYPGMVIKIFRPELEYEDWTVEGFEPTDKVKNDVEFKDNESVGVKLNHYSSSEKEAENESENESSMDILKKSIDAYNKNDTRLIEGEEKDN